LPEAERLYLDALALPDPEKRRRCYDQLLLIYARLGRQDRAIQIGVTYERLLQQLGDRARQRQLRVQMGECLFALGHWRSCEATLRQALADSWGPAPLPTSYQLSAVVFLARTADKRGNQDQARDLWTQVEALARAMLRNRSEPLAPLEQIECSRKLSESYRFLNKPAQAGAALEVLLPLHDQLRDLKGKSETLKLLGDCRLAEKNDESAEQWYRQALAILERGQAANPLLQGDLLTALADIYRHRNQTTEADKHAQAAVEVYEKVLKAPRASRDSSALTAFWKLQQHYQQGNQFNRALQLAEGQTDQWGPLVQPRLKVEQGYLKVIMGIYKDALALLTEAVDQLQKQDPPNLIDLTRALNNLAVAEQATEDPARAEKHGRECLELYRLYDLPADLIQVETYNLLGTAIALRGDYAAAIAQFRTGSALCDKLGPQADPQLSNLLLNIALLYKAQGDLEEALRACSLAQDVYERFAPPDALGRGAFHAARASILAALGRVAEAHKLVGPILELCNNPKYKIKGGPLMLTALNCQGLFLINQGKYSQAEGPLRQAVDLLEKEKQTLLLPRTLNYLALCAELDGKFDLARERYRKAYDLQQQGQRTFPVTQFITCWRLANVMDRLGRRPEAIDLLKQAVAVVESARLKTYGESQQRATYFGQFAPAFDQLVRWSLDDGDVEGAFAAIARGRSRTLLDQLQTAHVDPREALRGPEHEELRRREENARLRLGSLRAQAQLISVDQWETDRAKDLMEAFEKAREEYAKAWRGVVEVNPIYRSLTAEDPGPRALQLVRDLKPRTVLLVYFLGREQSWVLLGKDKTLKAFPLRVPEEIARYAASPPQPALVEALAGTRGMMFKQRQDLPDAPQKSKAGKTLPLTQEVARVVAENYQRQILNEHFDTSRAFILQPRKAAQPVPPQRLGLIGDMMLPPEVRKAIDPDQTDLLVVVPDGPLHKLPLESLLIETSKEEPAYLLDELPPIVYSPSLMILALLKERKPPPPGPLTLLTVANPAYPQPEKKVDLAVPIRTSVGLRGQLQLLPGTKTESERIQAYFDEDKRTALLGPDATEPRVTAAMRGKRVIHLAVHGFAEEQLGNLFGALALTPPAPGQESPTNDGFLSLNEIYTLPLDQCELAVLSACVTNVGPQRPLEAGVTLASGFLAAGARRVIASHWNVNDQSTAELMGQFFKEVTEADRKRGTVSYARALKKAQLHLRGIPDRSTPYYWAPFVLLGPED
jgi:CHAT domain-containing protein/tetratricopeptide (TPR) repeat protein